MTPRYQTVPSEVDTARLCSRLERVFAYWEELKKQQAELGGGLPTWQQFEWGRIPTIQIPWCTVVDLEQCEPISLRYRFWGSNKVFLHGTEYTGISTADIPDEAYRDKTLLEFAMVLKKKRPLLFNVHITSHAGNGMDYQCLRLPFTGTSGEVEKVLGASSLSLRDVQAIHAIFGIPSKYL